VASAATAAAEAAGVRYSDWLKAQVVQAVTLHRLSYARASHLYDVAHETIRKPVNGTAGAPAGLDRVEALALLIARVERYLVLTEAIRHQGGHASRNLHPVEHRNGHNGFDALHTSSHATAVER
jgi:hypothetical protein